MPVSAASARRQFRLPQLPIAPASRLPMPVTALDIYDDDADILPLPRQAGARRRAGVLSRSAHFIKGLAHMPRL